ncbi:MAG: PAS domain S-box protein [Pseudomonadota bacterium]
MTTSTRTIGRSARRLSRVLLLPVFAAALLLALWSGVLWEIGVERQTSQNDAVASSQAMARVLAEHVSHTLRQSDHATHLFKLKFEEQGALALAEFGRRGGLLDSVLPARLALPMAVLDHTGQFVDRVNGFALEGPGQAPFFRALAQTAADKAVFSAPVVAASGAKWHIQVARRLNTRSGQFAGAIILLIDPALFIDDYDRLTLSERGAMVLVSPGAGLSMGRLGEQLFNSDKLRFATQRASGGSSSQLTPNLPLDGLARIYSYSDMPRHGLMSVVGIESDVAMARFERVRTQYLITAVLGTLLILGVVAVLMKQSRRLRASMRAATEAQANLRAAAEGSLDGFVILGAWPRRPAAAQDFIVIDVNEKGAAMLGSTRADLLGKKAFATLPRLKSTGVFERYVHVYRTGQPVEEEIELHFEGEAPYWLHHQVVALPDGVAVTSRNITVRKHAEIEIHNNRGFLQSLVDHLPLLISVKSMRPHSRGTMLVWNHAAEVTTGYPADQVIGHTDSEAFPEDFALNNQDEDRDMVNDPRVVDLPDKPLRRADGSMRYLHSISVPLLDQAGDAEYILCIAEDVTRRREQEQELRTSEAQLAAVTNASPLGLVRTDPFGNCTYANQRFETITGIPREQALGLGWLAAFENDESAYMPLVFEHQRRNLEPFMKITRCVRPDGRMVWASTKIAAVRIDGRIEGFVGSIDDITTLREAELALRESEARLRTIADTLPTMVAYIDANQVYRFHNLAYDREFGSRGSAVFGMTIREVVGEHRFRTLEPYIRRALAGETLTFEEQDDSAGDDRILEVTYIPQAGEEPGSVVGFHVMRQDISSQRREKRHLLKLAQIDALTGLSNRAGFSQKLNMAMAESAREERLMALMYLDIDHFKPVNDTHGHSVGDQLLKAFSARLTATLRASDTVARLGGDEFTIIMEKLARREDAELIAAKIVKAMRAPFELDGLSVAVSASIGLAYYSDGELGPDALLDLADKQLYQAKQAGRNTYRTAA